MTRFRSLPLAALALAAACSEAPRTPLSPGGGATVPAPLLSVAGRQIPGSYIVVVKDGADPTSVAAVAGVGPKFVYTAALNGFAADLNAGQLTALQHNPNVSYVEPDQEVTADGTQTISGGQPWGIDRIDQRSLPLSASYTYTTTASTVTAYIIDTGIYTSDSDFGGRAAVAYDALGGNGQDCNGHGTHVSGTVGGTVYGVAKGVKLRAVRVLNCQGSGTTSGVIAGMNWVQSHAAKPAVANMSLGGGYSSSMNTAANNLANSGVFLAVAAGNSNANACNYSPSAAAAAFTVAASTSTDAKASYSNYGSCVDAYAPGSSIKSDWLNGGTNTISGTSMATPHVTGVAALYKGSHGDASSSTVSSWIVNNSTTGKITGNPSGTANRLLYKATL